MKTILVQLMAVVCLITITKNTCFSQNIPDIEETVVNSCVVSDVSGKVTYKENGAEMPVKAGTVLKEGATVTIPDGGSVTLAKDEQSFAVNKKGNYQVASMIKDVKEKGKVSRFARMAYAAKGYGDTTSKTTPPIKKAWGDKDSIIFFPPINGKLPLKPLKISWNASPKNPVYKLVIFQNSLETPLVSVHLLTSNFQFDPTQFAFALNKPCFAQVIIDNDSKSVSRIISFTFVPLNEEEIVLNSLKNEAEYLENNASNRLLLEAIVLSENGFTSSAWQRYKQVLEQDKNNALASKMYNAFLENSNK